MRFGAAWLLVTGCGHGGAESAQVTAGETARALALRPGTYVVRSASYRGDTLQLRARPSDPSVVDARATRGHAPAADDPVADGWMYPTTNAYVGRVSRSVSGGDVEFSLMCRCSAGRDPFGQPVYADSMWNGDYAVRQLAGGAIELRPVYGATAVDTLERR